MILLDTHVLVRWLAGGERLGTEQLRVLNAAERRGQPMRVSAITLIELAQLAMADVLRTLETNPAFQVLPITVAIAREAAILRLYCATRRMRPSSRRRAFTACGWSPPTSASLR